MNIASMAGLATGLGNINEVGYTASKWGTVAFTRSFATAKPNVASTEGIKAYAICPYFADTSLVRESVAIDDLQKRIKGRVLTVNEVGHAFEKSLEVDQTGACYVVFPDCPPFQFPDANMGLMFGMIAFGHKLAAPLGLETFNVKHFGIAVMALLLMFYMVLCIIF